MTTPVAKTIGLLTGGGDCPGLNAVIRAVVRASDAEGWDPVAVVEGWRGLVDGRFRDLGPPEVSGILPRGGTIIGTSRTNPYKLDGGVENVLQNFHDRGLDALVAIGGEDTLGVAARLYREHQLPIVGVPKTIDNDLSGTDYTFGFDTAVTVATEAIDRLHTTAESHNRVMVVEVMGRHAGWIALHSGISGSADVILIPEIPFDIRKVCEKIQRRESEGRHFSIVVVAEGAAPKGGTVSLIDPEHERLGGIGDKVANSIQEMTGKETRTLVLGHLQRGGSPTTFDRLLGLRFGAAAVRVIAEGKFGTMVALRPPAIAPIPIAEALAMPKLVPLDSDTIATARDLGISLGD